MRDGNLHGAIGARICRMGTFRTLLACTLAALVGGCSGDAGPDTRDAGPVDRGQHEAAAPDHARPDRAAPPDVGQPKPDLGAPKPDKGTPKPKAHKVAAIQYGAGDAALVSTACTQAAMPNVCALRKLVAQARAGGALLVVLPEYGFGWDQKVYEPAPTVGDNPATNTAWPQTLFIPTFASHQSPHPDFHHANGQKPTLATQSENVGQGDLVRPDPPHSGGMLFTTHNPPYIWVGVVWAQLILRP